MNDYNNEVRGHGPYVPESDDAVGGTSLDASTEGVIQSAGESTQGVLSPENHIPYHGSFIDIVDKGAGEKSIVWHGQEIGHQIQVYEGGNAHLSRMVLDDKFQNGAEYKGAREAFTVASSVPW